MAYLMNQRNEQTFQISFSSSSGNAVVDTFPLVRISMSSEKSTLRQKYTKM